MEKIKVNKRNDIPDPYCVQNAIDEGSTISVVHITDIFKILTTKTTKNRTHSAAQIRI